MIKRTFFLCLLSLALFGGAVAAQELAAEETVRVETRVVFIDTLVQDKRTRTPIIDLTRESFEVLDNGRPRSLTYFSHGGSARKRPLALVLSLDLWTSAILYLERPEIVESIISALQQLPPEDEISVVQTWLEPTTPAYPSQLAFRLESKTIEGFTHDRAKIYAALRSVQRFARENLPHVKMLFSFKDLFKAGARAGLGNIDPNSPDPPLIITPAPGFEDIIERAPIVVARERANSQVVIADFTDDLESNYLNRSAEMARKLIGAGVVVNGLVVERNLFGKTISALGELLSPALGQRFHTTSYYSKQTGGETVTISSPGEFNAAVKRIIGNLAARYSLGFTIGADEKDDGRMRRLEVRVKARDARGKNRKIIVSARRGYYLSEQMRTAP
ncbi:MAG: hypothetical protein H0V88_11575 [Pyrinomonadaceae bacterium]|nr:hypothetical protein [Pyrinomonadaceae bacterium]